MEDLKSALSTFLSDAAKYFKEDDLKLLLSEDIDDLVSLKCVSRTTLEEIGLADILIDHLLKAQQDDTVSAEELLRHPMDELQAYYDTDDIGPWITPKPYHPTHVKTYSAFQAEARAIVDRELSVCRPYGYEKVGWHACAVERMISMGNEEPAEGSPRKPELKPLKYRMNVDGKAIIPDIYAAALEAQQKPIRQATQFICREGLKNLDQIPGGLVTAWNLQHKGSPGIRLSPQQIQLATDPDLQANVTEVISRVTRCASAYGHCTALMSSVAATWAVKFESSEDELTMLISDPIALDANLDSQGNKLMTVPEAFVWSFAANEADPRHPFATAKLPGRSVRTTAEQRLEDQPFARKSLPASGGSSFASSSRGGVQTRSTAKAKRSHVGDVHCEYRLGPHIYYGRVGTEEAVIRIGEGRISTPACKREQEAYRQMEALQGLCIPEVIAEGTLETGQPYIAITYIQGRRYNYWRDIALQSKVIKAVSLIQACGVSHGDLIVENILVTDDNDIIIIDFDVALVHCESGVLEDEMAMLKDKMDRARKDLPMLNELYAREKLQANKRQKTELVKPLEESNDLKSPHRSSA